MDKKQFLQDLQEHTGTVKGWLNDLVIEIADHEKVIATLRDVRSRRIEVFVNELLPNLDEHTLHNLEERLPGVMGAKDISEIRNQELEAIKARNDGEFDPNNYENNRRNLVDTLDLAQRGSKNSDQINRVKGLRDLIDRGYGTDQYELWFFNIQYYLDWKRADEIVDELHAKSWRDVRSWFYELEQKLDDFERVASNTNSLISDLDTANVRYKKMQSELANIDATVLEKARIRVRAAIDAITEIPSWMIELSNLDKKILEQISALSKLQVQRQPLSEELKQLQKLCVEATKSSKKTVPDQCGEVLRAKRARCQGASYNRTSGGPDNNWMLTYLFYDSIFNHFGGGSHHHGGGRVPDRGLSSDATRATPQLAEQNRRYGS